MRSLNRTGVMVIPKQPFLDWLRQIDDTSDELTLADLAREPSNEVAYESPSTRHGLLTSALMQAFAKS
jgi:hypothetical protein